MLVQAGPDPPESIFVLFQQVTLSWLSLVEKDPHDLTHNLKPQNTGDTSTVSLLNLFSRKQITNCDISRVRRPHYFISLKNFEQLLETRHRLSCEKGIYITLS